MGKHTVTFTPKKGKKKLPGKNKQPIIRRSVATNKHKVQHIRGVPHWVCTSHDMWEYTLPEIHHAATSLCPDCWSFGFECDCGQTGAAHEDPQAGCALAAGEEPPRQEGFGHVEEAVQREGFTLFNRDPVPHAQRVASGASPVVVHNKGMFCEVPGYQLPIWRAVEFSGETQ